VRRESCHFAPSARHRIHGGTLLAGKAGLRERRIGRGWRARARHRLARERTFIDQAVDHACADAGFLSPRRICRARGRRQHLDQRRRAGVMRAGTLPIRRTPVRCRSGPRCSPIRRHIRNTMPRADAYNWRPNRRARVVLPSAVDVELFADVLEAVVAARIRDWRFSAIPPRPPRAAQRHAHHVARLELQAARHPVGIGPSSATGTSTSTTRADAAGEVVLRRGIGPGDQARSRRPSVT